MGERDASRRSGFPERPRGGLPRGAGDATPPGAGVTVPAPSALQAARPCLFGGSFDPVHRGHLHAARAALELAGVDHVVLVPAARPPHKPGVRLADGPARVAMLESALAGEPRCSIWAVELERSGPSYTIDTVRTFVELRRAADGLALLIGGDNVPGLAAWRDVDELLELVRPLVVLRDVELDRELAALRGRLRPEALARLEAGRLEPDPVRVSATELRAKLAAGEDPGDDLPADVLAYARAHRLYGPA